MVMKYMDTQIESEESRLNELSEKIIGAAFKVSNVLGIGFPDEVYENALIVELNLSGLKAEQQTTLKVYYKDELVGDYYADILVEDEIIIELKSVEEFEDNHIAECLNYLKISGLKLCLMINFSKPKIEIKRVVKGFGNK